MAAGGGLWPPLSPYHPAMNRPRDDAPRDEESGNIRLQSWKSIANYLGCSVRTARRWEAEEGLPVHRQMHKSQGSVYAYRKEIDAWRRRGEAEGPPPAALTPLPPDGPAIAVLPFAYVGPDAADDYLADGFTEEVIADLSKIRGLRVISRTSSMALKHTDKDARAIADQLSVGHLLEGTVRRHDDRLRISVRLIDPARDQPIWGEKYTGALGDVPGFAHLPEDLGLADDGGVEPCGDREQVTNRLVVML